MPSERHRRNSELIVQSAQKCFESKGVRKTTLVDIAHEAHITRELIYYYFSGKQDIIDSLLDMYVQDAVETARLWCDMCEQTSAAASADAARGSRSAFCEIAPLTRGMLEDAIAALRRFVFVSDGSRRSTFDVLDELGRRQEVFSRICSAIMHELAGHPTAKRLAYTFGYDDDPMAEDMFKLVTIGIIGLLDTDPNFEDARVVDLLVRHVKRPVA